MRRITDWSQVPIIIDLPFASVILGQTVESLKRKSQQGVFPAYKEGKEWRVEKELLQKYIREKCVMPSIIDITKERK